VRVEQLSGRVAVITGAGGGIGRALALRLASEGMRLALADVDTETLRTTAGLAEAVGAQVLAVPTDVRDAEAVDRLAAATVAEFGAVHVVCNNAGVSRMGSAWEVGLDDWKWVLDVGLWGVIHGVRSFLPHLLAQADGGHVVNTASIGGLVSAPYIGPYTAAKHAVVGLSKSLRRELRDQGANIGVTVVCPGAVLTDMDPNTPRPDAPKQLSPPARRMAERSRATKHEGIPPEDVAELVVTAIREGHFYVLPNGSKFLPAIRAEFDEVLNAPTA
jgi:NAD(P)-dependent dehydrogenase (short-subunit alcohol dehydrogenase family)